MTCDEDRIVAFLHGELSDADEQAFDQHLLICESCWRAVREDRAGRLAIERLRVPAPFGLADRVTASVGLAGAGPGTDVRSRRGNGLQLAERARSLPRSRMVAAAAVVVVLLGGTLGWALTDHRAGDPPQITGVVAMASHEEPGHPPLRDGERFTFGGQSLLVRSYQVDGVVTLVATSGRPFPMPASSHLVTGSSSTAWMATDGRLAMYGVNRRAGDNRESMFLVAAMPMAELPQVAARLHLI